MLAQSRIFQGLDPKLLERLLQDGSLRQMEDGDLLFCAEQPYSGEIYLVVSGEVIVHRPDGQDYSVVPGDFAGLSGFLDYAPYTSTASCRGEVDVLVLSDQVFNDIKDAFPDLSSAVNRSIAERIRRWNPARREVTGTLLQPVRNFMTAPFAACAAETSVEAAVRIMRRRKIGSLGVTEADGSLLGMVTPVSLAEAVILNGVAATCSLRDAVVEPAVTVSPEAQLAEAEHLQQAEGVKYLVVIDDGLPVGVLSQTDIVRALSSRAQRNLLLEQASEAVSLDDLQGIQARMADCASESLENNRRSVKALRNISDTHLAIMRRCVELTIDDLEDEGLRRPDVNFAVLVMGSGGRREMMLEPDQDNGLIIDDGRRLAEPEVARWFAEFSERFNGNLEMIGYPLCPGDIMARNPLFRKTLSEWQSQIDYLVDYPNEKGARWSNVVFDFDTLYGDDSLTLRLRRHLQQALGRKQLLLSLMVEDDAEGRPPLGMFGRLITSELKGSRGRIDVKRNGLRIIADAARIYALSSGVNARSTQERIDALVRLGLLDADFADSVAGAYEELISLVLDHQLEQRRRGEEPDKLINPREISPHLRDVLRDALLVVKRFQDKLQGEFARMNF